MVHPFSLWRYSGVSFYFNMNLNSFGHVSYYYYLLQKFLHLVGKKRKKKGKKRKKGKNATSPKEFFGKNGAKLLITPRRFLFLFLFYEIAQSRLRYVLACCQKIIAFLFLKKISTTCSQIWLKVLLWTIAKTT
jgi:hypothetical protein